MNADFWVAVAEAEDAVEDAETGLADTRAQYGAEVALVGDAWAGADNDMLAHADAVATAHERLEALWAIA